MHTIDEIRLAQSDPEKLEELYQAARAGSTEAEFASELSACYEQTPENLLLAAWYYRLRGPAPEQQASSDRSTVWKLAIPFAMLSGLVLGLLAATLPDTFLDKSPLLFLVWAPVVGAVAILFLAAASKGGWQRAAISIGALAAGLLYVLLMAPTLRKYHASPYLDQMLIDLPLLAWIAIGFALLGLRSVIKDRFSFLIKSIDVAITAGLYLIACMAFGGITIGMLQALSIEIPEVWLKFLIGGGFGLLPIIALASIYDPRLSPSEQDFSQGLSKFVANMMRLLLPLTLLVLVIYVVLIPLNFMEPFRNRDVLIVYNLMLFAIMGLLLGATPIQAGELSPRYSSLLRSGILAVAGLAVLVSLYAFSAILYRTFADSLTMNRLIVIGWNLINITILSVLFIQVLRKGKSGWVEAAQAVFSRATGAYVFWTLFGIVVIPLIFR